MEPLFKTGNEIVDQMGRLQITGNIIPAAWYRTICRDTGKPYLTAIVILSDIVYWYRPVEVRDEGSGQLLGFRKKFKSDLLQRSYQQMADQFGISKRDATNAIVELEKLGVIKRVFRNLELNGQIVPNVLFLKLDVDRLKHLTFPEENDETREKKQQYEAKIEAAGKADRGYPRFKRDMSPNQERSIADSWDTSLQNAGEGIPDFGETNTKNTYGNYDREYPFQSYRAIRKRFEEQIEYEILVQETGDKERLDELVETAVDILASQRQTLRINREEMDAERVKEKYLQLTMLHIKYVLDSLRKTQTKARNIRAVMVTALYNASSTMNVYYDNLYQSSEQRMQERGAEDGGTRF